MMTEGEVVEQLVEYMSVVLLGVSLIFTVVSAYIVALNYFIGEAHVHGASRGVHVRVAYPHAAAGGDGRRGEHARGAHPAPPRT